MLYREKAAQIAEGEARKKVREQGSNRGPRVEVYQRADGLKLDPDTGYAWCASFAVWAYETAGRPLVELHESASVGYLLSYAGKHGWRIAKPSRGDLVCFYWDAGDWPDHVGIVTKVRADGSLETVEGNTSGPEGDGVYAKTRDPKTLRVSYIRVPGEDPKPDLVARATFAVMRGVGPRARIIAV